MKALTRLSAAALIFCCCSALAATISGVDFPDKVSMGTQQHELLLNGAGVRSYGPLKLYAVALYVTNKASTARNIIASETPTRIEIVMLRDATSKQVVDGLIKPLVNNNSQEDVARTQASIDHFRSVLLEWGQFSNGTKFSVDYVPGDGTRLFINDIQQGGRTIPGFDFYQEVLRIWIGDNPGQPSLKDALLGKDT
jgi:hypothetical protein